MNDDHQIAAESRYNFHILPHFNSKTTELIFTNFLYDVEALVPLLKRAFTWRYGILKSEQRVKAANVAEESMVKLSTPAVQLLMFKLQVH